MGQPDVQWRKSEHSSSQGGQCVEVAYLATSVGVRDSKDPPGLKLAFSRAARRAFADRVKTNEFDPEG
ncbi:DUF397 domain-containing protein [Actinomadura sp. 1N219]|uniref:DUF397 domain-containing protein n=1 Tax=Actinomadura sp. 1N219 TaxID=3375152 RepID=UPI0037A8E8E8